jgi:hypothetical protein
MIGPQSTTGASAPEPEPYEPLRTITRVLLAAFVIIILVDIVAVVSDLAEVSLLNRAIDGEFISDSEFDNNDNRQAVIGVLQTILYIGTGIVFLRWMYIAHRNLPALGARDLRFSHRWGVISWFIPILNLFRPYQVTGEIVRGSNPGFAFDDQTWKDASPPAVMGFWWAAWLASSWLGRLLFRVRSPTPRRSKTSAPRPTCGWYPTRLISWPRSSQ